MKWKLGLCRGCTRDDARAVELGRPSMSLNLFTTIQICTYSVNLRATVQELESTYYVDTS